MKIDLNDPNPPVKCCFDDDDPSAGYVLLRRMTVAEAQRIRKICAKRQPPVFHRGQMYEPAEILDEERQTELYWDYVIAGWDGITDADGAPIPCTTATKKQLMLQSPVFASFVTTQLEKLEALQRDIRGDQIKNS